VKLITHVTESKKRPAMPAEITEPDFRRNTNVRQSRAAKALDLPGLVAHETHAQI
jgi:hypothetical protein